MKIALLAPPLYPLVSNLKYGGIERIILGLAQGMVGSGNEVTIFAPAGSNIPDRQIAIRCYSTPGESVQSAERNLFQMVIRDQNEFDLIQSFLEPAIARNGSGNYYFSIDKPLVISFQNSTRIPEYQSYYLEERKLWRFQYTFISRSHARPLNFLPKSKVIYNGIDLSKITYNPKAGSKLVFLGRIMPEKGILEAIELALRLGIGLEIGAKIDEQYQEFFEREVQKQLSHPLINYLGEVSDRRRDTLLGNGIATLCLINWHEPFGLAAVESLAAGTPVIARDLGALPEIIEDGKSGLIISEDCSISECADMFKEQIDSIRREDCRRRAEEFSLGRMVSEYRKLYQELV